MPQSHVRRVSEINIATHDANQTLRDLGGIFGVGSTAVTVQADAPVQARFGSLEIPGDTSMGIIESTSPGSPIDRFLQRRGEGLFSISLEVDDVEATMRDWKAKGIEFVLDEPLVRHNSQVAGEVWATHKVNFTKRGPLLHGLIFEIQELHR